MNRVAFTVENSVPVKSILPESIQFITLQADETTGPRSITLWSSDKAGVRIRSRMHDLNDRHEIGVLDFTRVETFAPDERRIAHTFHGNRCEFKKLIINDMGVSAESGIALLLNGSGEIVIVAGAFPHSLAINGLRGWDFKFDPEYSMEEYVHEALI